MALRPKLKLEFRKACTTARATLSFQRPALADVVLTLGIASLTIVGLGLLGVPGYHKLQLRAKSAAVIGNAATLQLAAESYAAAHGGQYAGNVEDLVRYLPGKRAPVNPYSAEDIVFRGGAGDLTYQVRQQTRTYVIRAYAKGPGGKPKLVASLAGHGER